MRRSASAALARFLWDSCWLEKIHGQWHPKATDLTKEDGKT